MSNDDSICFRIRAQLIGMQYRDQECSKEKLSALVKELPDGANVPAKLVKEIVSCLITPAGRGRKKDYPTIVQKMLMAEFVGSLAKAKGRGCYEDAIESISFLWGGVHAGDQSKEIKAALKKIFSKENEPHIWLEVLQVLSEDEIKKIPFPKNRAEYEELCEFLLQRVGV